MILTHTFYPDVKFDSLVLVEPMLINARHFRASGRKPRFYEAALARRDFWESRDDALNTFLAKGMKTWDKRVVKLFVVSGTAHTSSTWSPIKLQEHGLRETNKDDPFDRPGVTLKCPKVLEAVALRDRTSLVLAFDFLERLCMTTPVHVIWGTIDDYMCVEPGSHRFEHHSLDCQSRPGQGGHTQERVQGQNGVDPANCERWTPLSADSAGRGCRCHPGYLRRLESF